MEETKDIIEVSQVTGKEAVEFFSDAAKVGDMVEKIREKVRAEKSDDVSTKKARDYIKSLAYKVKRTKTTIDDAGKALVAELKELPKKIDASRKEIRDALDALSDEVRQPLDEWEAAEAAKERLASERREKIANIGKLPAMAAGRKSSEIAEFVSGLVVEGRDFATEFGDLAGDAEVTARQTRETLIAMLDTAKLAEEAAKLKREKEEAERLEAIRAEAKAKAERDAELEIIKAKQREEAAEKARIEAEERAKRQAEAAEKARIEAEERAKRQAEAAEKARIEALEQAKKDAELAAEKAKAAEIARQKAEEKRIADEEARKEADKAYKVKVYLEITADLVAAGIPEEWAKACIKAVNQGKVQRLKVLL